VKAHVRSIIGKPACLDFRVAGQQSGYLTAHRTAGWLLLSITISAYSAALDGRFLAMPVSDVTVSNPSTIHISPCSGHGPATPH
jgi:hypothetical protein